MKKIKNSKRLAMICGYASIACGMFVWLCSPLFLNGLMPLFWTLIIICAIIYVVSLAILFAEFIRDVR